MQRAHLGALGEKRVDLVDEDYGRFVAGGHRKEGAHHLFALADLARKNGEGRERSNCDNRPIHFLLVRTRQHLLKSADMALEPILALTELGTCTTRKE